LFLSAAAWFVVGSTCALLVSIKFHAPGFLSADAWFTFGRLEPAGYNALLYGGCIQAGLAVCFWLLASLGQAVARQIPLLLGAVFWNAAVTLGVAGILWGDSTGFAGLEMPAYSVVPLFLGYVLLALGGVLLFHHRQRVAAFPSDWFVLGALFWFPWIYSTAELLLVAFPVRGVGQSVIAWWYGDNLRVVWLGLVGLAAVFYFVARSARRPLHSYYLALFTFWVLLLFGSWGGIPNTAPVPAWMPTVSEIATVLLIIPIIAVALNVHRTMAGQYATAKNNPALAFVLFGAAAFVVAGLMTIGGVLADVDQELHFTWFPTATRQLYLYGFFGLVMFGAIYDILPRLFPEAVLSVKLVRLHFWLALLGVIILVPPLAIAGVVQDLQFINPKTQFLDSLRSTLPFLRASTLGDLLWLAGSAVFLLNLLVVVVRFYRAPALAAYSTATADLFKPRQPQPTEVKA
jgi:cytochrome c oxidase cbb3-type subunit I